MKMTKKEKLDAIIKLLQKEALNRRQLATEVGCTIHSVDKYILELSAEKLIHVEYYVRARRRPTPYWRAGNKLSAPRPYPLSKQELQQEHRLRKQTLQQQELSSRQQDSFLPRRDIASSWF